MLLGIRDSCHSTPSSSSTHRSSSSSSMKKRIPFKQEFSLEERKTESKEILSEYPDRVPVIVERYSRTDLPELEKRKSFEWKEPYLMTYATSVYFSTASLMGSIYDTCMDEDGFLYVCYSSEKTFG
ncbi:autophagy-related protein 8D-like isoform X2 [Nymphaea colorata]|uniref:autophagy-related protein 8D-like isoform X2 n=1 Tax=Nymphaea colorata TaxID=210225 RepID=UPI00129EBB27|nr:autophagy-related protein 8D-like isoform X2 [Nymphaea colorata]